MYGSIHTLVNEQEGRDIIYVHHYSYYSRISSHVEDSWYHT